MAGSTTLPKVRQTRQAAFCASHRLNSMQISDDENRLVYGKCNNPRGHGHNYRVKVTVFGTVNPKTGMVVNMAELEGYINLAVMETMDHKNLDEEVGFFLDNPSTPENVAIFIWNNMKQIMAHPELLYSVKVYETENSIAVFRGHYDYYDYTRY